LLDKLDSISSILERFEEGGRLRPRSALHFGQNLNLYIESELFPLKFASDTAAGEQGIVQQTGSLCNTTAIQHRVSKARQGSAETTFEIGLRRNG
jgi:hypothetical protein